MTWTTRLKRYGGLRAIEAARARQFELIARTMPSMPLYRQAIIARNLEWLNEHPLRVLSKEIEDYFWPPQRDLDIVEMSAA